MTSSKTVSLLGKELTQDTLCSYLYENKAEHLSAWENSGTWRVKYAPAAMFSLTGQGDTIELAEKELRANMILRMKGIQNLLGFVASYTMEELKNLPRRETKIFDPGPPDYDWEEDDDPFEEGDVDPFAVKEKKVSRYSLESLFQNKALEEITPEQITILAKIAQSKYSSTQEKERLLALTHGLAFDIATVMIEGQSAEAAGSAFDWARNVLEEWAAESGVHVHVTHCCVHFCKYGNDDCPVYLKQVQSAYHGKKPCVCDY